MADIVEQVKERNKIEDVVGEEFPLSSKRGRYLRAKGHDSLVIDTKNQAYHWNSRNESGDVITWVEKRQGADFKTAVELLCKRAGLPDPDWGRQDTTTRLIVRARQDAFTVAASVFSRWLFADVEALAYARGRGWTDETIQGGMLGYTGGRGKRKDLAEEMRRELVGGNVDLESPGAVAITGFTGDVAEWAAAQHVEVNKEWVERGYIVGLLGRDLLLYPHLFNGRVQYFSGRGVREKMHFNLPASLAGARKPYLNTAWSFKEQSCVVVEGQADANSLAQWGIPAMAVCGTSVDEAVLAMLKGHEFVYLGLNADQAGKLAQYGIQEGGVSKRMMDLLDALGPMVRLIDWKAPLPSPLPEGEGVNIEDANDLLRVMVNAGVGEEDQAAMIQGLMSSAEPFVIYAARWAGAQDGAEGDKAQEEAMKVIALMDPVRQEQYMDRLADLMGIGMREFKRVLKAVSAAAGKNGKGRKLEIVETLGGFYDDHLVEYVYDPVASKAMLVWRDPEGRVQQGDHLDIDGRRYVPETPDAFVTGGGVLFPAKMGERKSTRELVGIVEMFISQHYLLGDDKLARIIAYYVMLTWVYDCFATLPYLRAMGEPGAGKSELMMRVGHLCYRLMVASGAATAASLFRTVEVYRGTVFIDEADLHDGGDMANDIVKFLNSGAMKGNPIWRLDEVTNSEGKRVFRPALYTTFCPKLIAMRRDFKDDAVGTRSITLKLMPREPLELVKAGVPLIVGQGFKEQAMAIRNLLLRWRMELWQPEIPVREEDIDLEISSRLNQVTLPLLAIAQEDEKLRSEIRMFLREYNADIVLTRSMTLAARIVEAMWKIYRYPDLQWRMVQKTEAGREYMMIGDVTKIANEIMDKMNKTGDDEDSDDDGDGKRKRKRDTMSPRKTGHVVRNELQLQVGARMTAGFPVFWDGLKMEALAKRYGTAIPEVDDDDEDDAEEAKQLEFGDKA